MTNNQLRALMKRHHISIHTLANLLEVSVATVRAWLRPKTSKAQRNMTKKTEALLKERLGLPASPAPAAKASPAPVPVLDSDSAASA
jgi:transcriptional regulator with XRE-family HTH domain